MPTFNAEETMGTVRQLFDKANMNHGWTLMPSQVRSIVVFIQQIDASLDDASAKSESVDEITNMLAAYVNEYGKGLYNTLLEAQKGPIQAPGMGGDIVEGEVEEPENQPYDDAAAEAYMKEVYDNADEDEEEDRFTNEGGRVDAQVEEQE